VALVIGNGNYAGNALENPVKDARGMAAALRELGFDVLAGENATRAQMLQLLRSFGERLRGGGVGLFYFAGHGVQAGGINYLIPIGHKIEDEPDVKIESVSLEAVLDRMEAADNRVNLVILDACRDNPFRSFSRSQARGLAHVQAPSGTLIAYSTQPGNTAADGNGRPNSPYTTSLLQHIRTPGLKIEDFFKRVRVSVEALTARKQTPWEHSSLARGFLLRCAQAGAGWRHAGLWRRASLLARYRRQHRRAGFPRLLEAVSEWRLCGGGACEVAAVGGSGNCRAGYVAQEHQPCAVETDAYARRCIRQSRWATCCAGEDELHDSKGGYAWERDQIPWSAGEWICRGVGQWCEVGDGRASGGDVRYGVAEYRIRTS
jgi:hypothetical protein